MAIAHLQHFFQQRGQAAIEINRLRCSTGNSPTDSSNRNGSLIAGTPSSPVDKVSLMCDNVSRSRSAHCIHMYFVEIESNFLLLFIGDKIGEGKCPHGSWTSPQQKTSKYSDRKCLCLLNWHCLPDIYHWGSSCGGKVLPCSPPYWCIASAAES